MCLGVMFECLHALQSKPRTTFDNQRVPHQDIRTVEGLLLALGQVLRLQRAGLLWLGIPCSSFSWMSSSAHRRHEDEDGGMGDDTYEFVREGNLIATRSLLLALVAMSRGALWFLDSWLSSV